MDGLLGREFDSPHLHFLTGERKASPFIFKEENRLDKRVKSTKEQLYISFLKMMKDLPIEKITISSLCKVAGINRNTFYTHYESVSALLGEIEDNFANLVKKEYYASIDPSCAISVEAFMEKLLLVVKNNMEICKLFFSDNGDRTFVTKLLGEIFPEINHLWSEMAVDEKYIGIAYSYIAGGAIKVIEDWVLRDCDDDIKHLASFLDMMIMKGQSAFFA